MNRSLTVPGNRTMSSRGFVLRRLASCCVLVIMAVAAGCAPVQVLRPESIAVDSPAGLSLPVAYSADVFVPPEIGQKILRAPVRGARNLNEGSLLKRAADTAFRKVFTTVRVTSEPGADFLATVEREEASVSSFSGAHTVSVTMRISRYGISEIGVFTGAGRAISGALNDAAALENAFIEAMVDILDQLLASETFRDAIS